MRSGCRWSVLLRERVIIAPGIVKWESMALVAPDIPGAFRMHPGIPDACEWAPWLSVLFLLLLWLLRECVAAAAAAEAVAPRMCLFASWRFVCGGRPVASNAYICNNSFVLFPMPQVDGGLGDLLESFQDEEMRSLMLQAAAAVQVSAWGAVRPMSTAASISGISGGGRDGSMLVIGFICYGLCDSFKFASYCHVF